MEYITLVIGNGFDLAHELPTKYSDFIAYYENNKVEIDNKYVETTGKIAYQRNIWLEYFLYMNKQNQLNDRWIDLEKEMSCLIKFIDENANNLNLRVYELIELISKEKFNCEDEKCNLDYFLLKVLEGTMTNKTIAFLREKLLFDLNFMIKMLDQYLEEILKQNNIQANEIFKDIKPNRVISFNYTNTAESVFPDLGRDNIMYIHGKCGSDPNNMVLGIEEYWGSDKKDKHTNFVVFKKFVQRIQKNSPQIKDEVIIDMVQSRIIFYGHSLDKTDEDVLNQILNINNGNNIIEIYCLDVPTQGEYIANLINLIGQDRLIKKIKEKRLIFTIIE